MKHRKQIIGILFLILLTISSLPASANTEISTYAGSWLFREQFSQPTTTGWNPQPALLDSGLNDYEAQIYNDTSSREFCITVSGDDDLWVVYRITNR